MSDSWHGCCRFQIYLLLTAASVLILPTNQLAIGELEPSSLREYALTAEMVSSKMRQEVEPCDDFYEFVCGNFIKKTVIPDDKSKVTMPDLLKDDMSVQLQNILNEERPETDPKHLKLPNLLYKECMNTDLIEKLRTEPMQEISKSLGGWPVIAGKGWDSDNQWTWQETVKKLRALGFEFQQLVKVEIYEDPENTSSLILSLEPPKLLLSAQKLANGLNDSKVLSYYQYMLDVAEEFGSNLEAAKMELMESLKFEIKLAKISLKDPSDSSSPRYTYKTVKEIQEAFPYVQWKDYINSFLPKGLVIDENEKIIVRSIHFLKKFGELLERTEKRIIANYLLWRAHEYIISALHKDIRVKELVYNFDSSGIIEETPRSDWCVKVVLSTRLLLPVMGFLYVRKYVPNNDTIITALEMFNLTRNALEEILDQASWMDSNTQLEAKNKLHNITPYIGYPKEILEESNLAEYLQYAEVVPNKFLQTLLHFKRLYTDETFKNLRLPIEKSPWINRANPTMVYAYYFDVDNSIQIPVSILQGYIYNALRPKYMNYGGLGFVLAHEMTHAFDNQGRKYDSNGNKINWWSSETEKAFLEKVQCMIEQYSNYTEEQTGLQLNGKNTLNENIADNGAVKASYLAYSKWLSVNGEEPKLPGFENYTSKQMFWISTAHGFCAKFKTESLKGKIKYDWHSPNKYRIIGTLQNNKDFSTDFNCRPGSPMNPANKCEVW